MADPTGNYTFLPWYRTGLSALVKGDELDQDRARDVTIRARLDVTIRARIGANLETFPKTVRLIGPGDIVGIDPRAVVRVDPRPNANDYESNYVAAIEFFDEDYPWRYSPSPPQAFGKERVMPWLALVALEEGEFSDPVDQGPGLPRKFTVATSKLPPADQAWAWAHAHLNMVKVNAADKIATANQIAANPAASCSRIMAARCLEPLKVYRAFLVPVFEAGRRSGLLSPAITGRRLAWEGVAQVELPIYYEWTFRTGEGGDFRELVLRLKAFIPPDSLGRRPMDVAQPLESATLPAIENDETPPRPVLHLQGTLQVPGAEPSPWLKDSREKFQGALAGLLNLGNAWAVNPQHKLQNQPPLPNGIKLPVIVPPIYGQHHAKVEQVDAAQAGARWLEQINLDPRNRVAAALGTLVVQRNQEEFVARAWKQYGELFEANRLRSRAQLFREVLTAIEAKHLQPLPDEHLLAVTSMVQARVLAPGEARLTVYGKVQQSPLPVAALQSPMRRVLRGRGPVVRRFGTASQPLAAMIRDVGTQRREISPTWSQPPERFTLATTIPAELRDTGPVFLGVDWDERFRPLLQEYRKTTARLAANFSELQDTLRIVDELIARGEDEVRLTFSRFTPQAFSEIRQALDFRPDFAADVLREEDFQPVAENRNFFFLSWTFRQALLNSAEFLAMPVPAPLTRPPLDIGGSVAQLRARLSPYESVAERVGRVVQTPPIFNVPRYDPLEQILQHPRYDDATYEYLLKISSEHLIPNLDKLPNNSVTLLEVNWAFIESFLVGLNHEMARELLWRGYPTDQRGSYFRLFWDVRNIPGAFDAQRKVVERYLDIAPIHGWKLLGQLRALGSNRPEGRPDVKNLVLVIKGDLLRRYPNTHVYAAPAQLNPQPRAEFPAYRRAPADGGIRDPILFAKLGFDTYCYGFELEQPEAEGDENNPGWYFALAERYGEPRFGLNASGVGAPATADALAWTHLGGGAGPVNVALQQPPAAELITEQPQGAPASRAKWGVDAADTAAIFFRKPFRLFYHASSMLKGDQ